MVQRMQVEDVPSVQAVPPVQAVPDSIEDLQRRLAVLRESAQNLPVARTLSSGQEPQFNSGSVIADHPRQDDKKDH